MGAISSYVESRAASRPPDAKDQLLLPNLLKQLAIVSELGINFSLFRCAGELSFELRVIGFILLPLACFLAPGVWFWVQFAINWARRSGHACCMKGLRGCCLRGCRVDGHSKPPKDLAVNSSDVGVFALFLVLPMATSSLAQLQNCEKDELGAYLVIDPSISCKKYPPYITAAKWFMWIYLVVPIVLFACFYFRAPFRAHFSFLHRGYHNMSIVAVFYDCVTLIRKMLVVGLASRAINVDFNTKDPRANMIASIEILAFSKFTHAPLHLHPSGARITRHESRPDTQFKPHPGLYQKQAWCFIFFSGPTGHPPAKSAMRMDGQ
jgi:hypothetical protein